MAPARVAVFAPSYFLRHDQTNLTTMGRQAVTCLFSAFRNQDNVVGVIISASYDTWEKEAEIRRNILQGGGISDALIHVVSQATDSYDEADKVSEICRKLGVTHL